MSHKGRPYPWVTHYDVWLFNRGTLFQMAARYKCVATKNPSGGVNCLDFEAMTSEAFERDASMGLLKWHFEWPCTPVAWNFDLEYLVKSPLEDSKWRYSLYNGATLVNRTIELPQVNPYGSPTSPNSLQWVNPTSSGSILFNTPCNPVPWPP